MVELECFEGGTRTAGAEVVAGDAFANVVSNNEVESAPGREVQAQHGEDGVHLILGNCDALCVALLVDGGNEDCESSGEGNLGMRGQRAGGEDAVEQVLCTEVVGGFEEDESCPERWGFESNCAPVLADVRDEDLKVQRWHKRAQRLPVVRPKQKRRPHIRRSALHKDARNNLDRQPLDHGHEQR